MYLCDDGHDEVCYEGKRCPVCYERENLTGELESKVSEIERLMCDNKDFEEEISRLENQITNLRGDN